MTVLRSSRVRRLGAGAIAISVLALAAPATAAAVVGTLEASVVDCTPIDGQLHGVVGISVTGAPPSTTIWLRVTTPLATRPPIPFVIGATDASGTLVAELPHGPSDAFPTAVSASTSEKIDPATQVGEPVLVEFVCPVLTPQNVLDAAVDGGIVSEREAAPLAVKLGVAAAQELKGNVGVAVHVLAGARLHVQALIASGRLATSEALPLLDAIDRDIARLEGGP